MLKPKLREKKKVNVVAEDDKEENVKLRGVVESECVYKSVKIKIFTSLIQ